MIHRRVFTAAALAVFLCGTAIAQDDLTVSQSKVLAETTDRYLQTELAAEIKAAADSLKQAKKGQIKSGLSAIDRTGNRWRYPSRDSKQADIEQLEHKLDGLNTIKEAMEKHVLFFYPDIPVPVSAGEFGQFRRGFNVFQVLGTDRVLIKYVRLKDQLMMLETDTSGMTNGLGHDTDIVFECVGTTTYQSGAGPNTVPLLRPLDKESVESHLRPKK